MAKMAQAIRKGIRSQKFKYSRRNGTAYHWTYVLRAKDKKKRELIARGMERAVKCGKISYSNESNKNARLYDAVKKHKFDCMRLKKRTTTNCCNLASVACNYAGIKTPRKNSATTLPSKWGKMKDFKVIRYKHGKTKLKRGDILDASHKPKIHTAVYLG